MRATRPPFRLRGEWNHRGGAAARRRTRAGLEVVGHAHRLGHRLVEVAMGVDSARQDIAARGVDFTRAALQPLAERRDSSAMHADVAALHVA